MNRRVHALIVRTESLQHLPHHLVTLVIAQRLSGRHAVGNSNRQNNVAVLLTLSAAHHATYRLNNIHHRVAGIQEKHRVKIRNVHTLSQAASVRQDTTNFALLIRLLLEPVQELGTALRVEAAVNVANLHAKVISRVVVLRVTQVNAYEVLKLALNLLGILNRTVERHGALHRCEIITEGSLQLTATALSEAVPTTHQLRHIINGKLVGFVSQKVLEGGRNL